MSPMKPFFEEAERGNGIDIFLNAHSDSDGPDPFATRLIEEAARCNAICVAGIFVPCSDLGRNLLHALAGFAPNKTQIDTEENERLIDAIEQINTLAISIVDLSDPDTNWAEDFHNCTPKIVGIDARQCSHTSLIPTSAPMERARELIKLAQQVGCKVIVAVDCPDEPQPKENGHVH